MQYNKLANIILADFLDNNGSNKEDIIKNVQKKDFHQKIDRLIFDYSKKIITKRGKPPKIKELIIQTDIAYNIYKTNDDSKPFHGEVNKEDLSYLLEQNNGISKKLKDYLTEKIAEKIADGINNKDQETIYYIEKFKNESHLLRVKKEVNKIQERINQTINTGKEYNPAEIFRGGFDFIFKEDLNNKNLEEIVAAQRKEAENGNRIPTYIDVYDNNYLNGGVKKGYIEIIGAKTGMGKSTYAVSRFYNQIINSWNVYYITFEEDIYDILEKVLTIHSNHDPKFNEYNLTSKDWLDMGAACKDEEKLRVMDEVISDLKKYRFEDHIIDMRSRNTVEDIKSELMNMSLINEKEPIDLIYLDHIHNINAADNNANFTTALKYIMGSIRVLASKSKISLSILTQLNDRGKGKPTKQNLKWSQSLANDAHLVTLIYRSDYGLSDQELEEKGLINNNQMELIIDKNRHGETGRVKLYFDFKKSYIRGWKSVDESNNEVVQKKGVKGKDQKNNKSRQFSKSALEGELLPKGL